MCAVGSWPAVSGRPWPGVDEVASTIAEGAADEAMAMGTSTANEAVAKVSEGRVHDVAEGASTADEAVAGRGRAGSGDVDSVPGVQQA